MTAADLVSGYKFALRSAKNTYAGTLKLAEMRDALREAGWHNYSLFLGDDGALIGYLECEDFRRRAGGHGGHRVTLAGRPKWPSFSASSRVDTPMRDCTRARDLHLD